MTKIIVDAFGGDHAPLVPIEGAMQAVKELGVEVILVGDEAKINAVVLENSFDMKGITIHHASDMLSMEDDATDILKKRPDTSMGVGLKLLAAGEGDAFVSAGSTGALLVGATGLVKRIKGVKRAALATVLPGAEKSYLLLDCGANVECRPEMLAQFGLVGSVYMEKVMNREKPVVCLANNGTEETKGTEMIVEAYQLMRNMNSIHFGGNIEARDIPTGAADVVVADGFTGNIILKLTEGLAKFMTGNLKEMFYTNTKTKLAAAMLKKNLGDFKAKLDYTEYGGAPLLGIAKPVIKAHGSSNAKAFKNAIRQAKTFAEANVTDVITEAMAKQKEVAEGD